MDKTRKKGKRQKLQKRNRSKKLGLSEIGVTRMRSTARVNLRSFKSSSFQHFVFSGRMFGVLQIVFPFLNSYTLLD